MSEAKRYDHQICEEYAGDAECPGMVESEDGEYVEYKDYEALQAENEESKALIKGYKELVELLEKYELKTCAIPDEEFQEMNRKVRAIKKAKGK